ncbi:DUF6479 family protein [Streptomyces sp. 142MFCol3.1]|uniref:DUF6479 family protein n=1 Tax=Streptomyces sp. 142MFCol3.1 TaxID=1172179 RepID=UPI003B638A34
MAASIAGPMWLAVGGIAVVLVLLVAFFIGSRRSTQRRVSPSTPQAAQARRELAHPPRRGEGWTTPDDDPEQGHPHR